MDDMRIKRPRRGRQEWQSLVDALETSPLDLPAFCQQHGIKPERLRYWRRRLNPSKFIELPGVGQHPRTGQETWDVELILGQGITLHLRSR